MKIPNNKVLTGLCFAGTAVAALSSYWIGRRDELEEIINLGRDIEDRDNFRVLDIFDEKGNSVELFVRAENVSEN